VISAVNPEEEVSCALWDGEGGPCEGFPVVLALSLLGVASLTGDYPSIAILTYDASLIIDYWGLIFGKFSP
jgi:hypothetical protein